jgi:hypothetical protein
LNEHSSKDFFPFNGKCVDNCPIGYLRNNESSSCIKVCDNITFSGNLTNYFKESSYKGCQIVRGYLKFDGFPLQLCYQQGVSLVFRNFITSLIEIDGQLIIKNSTFFYNLFAFKSLQKIGSTNLAANESALIVKNNTNLNHLWSSDQNVTIQGESHFSSNPSLCMNCAEISDIEANPNAYVVYLNWKLPDTIKANRNFSYYLSVYKLTSELFCDSP